MEFTRTKHDESFQIGPRPARLAGSTGHFLRVTIAYWDGAGSGSSWSEPCAAVLPVRRTATPVSGREDP